MSVYDVDAMLAELALKKTLATPLEARKLISNDEMKRRVAGINEMHQKSAKETEQMFSPEEYPMHTAEEEKEAQEKRVVLFTFDKESKITKDGRFYTEAEALSRMEAIKGGENVYRVCIVVNGEIKVISTKE